VANWQQGGRTPLDSATELRNEQSAALQALRSKRAKVCFALLE
jgi:hypothetical protein